MDVLEIDNSDNSTESEIEELVGMAISDLETHEAAEVLLKYKLSDKLNTGQISNMSYEMVEDDGTDQNSDINLHYPMFNINQLLYKSYNGKFPHSKATEIEFELTFPNNPEIEIDAEIVLICISKLLTDNSPIVRLYEEELQRTKPFNDAPGIVWQLNPTAKGCYTLITSDYWINDDDLQSQELSGNIPLPDEIEEEEED